MLGQRSDSTDGRERRGARRRAVGTAQTIRRRVLPARGERGGRGRPPQELELDDEHRIREVDHPVIEEKGATLRTLDAGGADAAQLQVLAEELVELIDGHFQKEEQILFPMCLDLLSPEVLDGVGQEMQGMAPVQV